MKGLVGASALISIVLIACAKEPIAGRGTLAVHGTADEAIRIAVGQELDLTVGTVGPGEYVAPPSISSGALRFLDAQITGPHLPSGPTQLFRFQGQSRGIAVVAIRHSGNNPTIRDTVIVQ